MANHSVAASLINAASLSLLWEPVIPSPAGASGASARTRSHATAELSHCTLRSANLKASALNLFLLLQHLIKIELFVLSFGAGAGPKKGQQQAAFHFIGTVGRLAPISNRRQHLPQLLLLFFFLLSFPLTAHIRRFLVSSAS